MLKNEAFCVQLKQRKREFFSFKINSKMKGTHFQFVLQWGEKWLPRTGEKTRPKWMISTNRRHKNKKIELSKPEHSSRIKIDSCLTKRRHFCCPAMLENVSLFVWPFTRCDGVKKDASNDAKMQICAKGFTFFSCPFALPLGLGGG